MLTACGLLCGACRLPTLVHVGVRSVRNIHVPAHRCVRYYRGLDAWAILLTPISILPIRMAGHFVSIFIVHVFCNVMGFPDLSFFSPENSLHPFRKGTFCCRFVKRVGRFVMQVLTWRSLCALAVILGSYFVGIYLFSRLLYPLTDPGIYSSDLWNITVSAVNDQDLVYRFADAL
jgi:hypothetical protein